MGGANELTPAVLLEEIFVRLASLVDENARWALINDGLRPCHPIGRRREFVVAWPLCHSSVSILFFFILTFSSPLSLSLFHLHTHTHSFTCFSCARDRLQRGVNKAIDFTSTTAVKFARRNVAAAHTHFRLHVWYNRTLDMRNVHTKRKRDQRDWEREGERRHSVVCKSDCKKENRSSSWRMRVMFNYVLPIIHSVLSLTIAARYRRISNKAREIRPIDFADVRKRLLAYNATSHLK